MMGEEEEEEDEGEEKERLGKNRLHFGGDEVELMGKFLLIA